ncbi:MAG TPA: response regulator [Telluria sp.]|nr:response regulator [Telluria sp.]
MRALPMPALSATVTIPLWMAMALLGAAAAGLLLALVLAARARALRKRLERGAGQLADDEASRKRLDLLEAMSHEIRTPLAGVIGMFKFALRDRAVQGRTLDYLRIGLHHGESLLATMNDILPLAEAAASPEQAAPKRRERHRHQLRVLCAEDLHTNQIIVGTLLENMGHQVRIVENGIEALRALSAADFDLVLMDGRMPLMDGEQATRLIRGGGTETDRVRNAAIPIIALTANASAPDCQRYLAAGMNGFLSKPLDEGALHDQLDTTIAELLARGQALRAATGDAAAPVAHKERELARQFGITPFDEAPAPAVQIAPLAGLSSKHMERITLAFLEEAPRRLAMARKALDDGDAAATTAAFHALKGSAGYLSTPDLHQLAHRLERLAAAELMDEVAHLFPQAEQAVRRAIDSLQAATRSNAA